MNVMVEDLEDDLIVWCELRGWDIWITSSDIFFTYKPWYHLIKTVSTATWIIHNWIGYYWALVDALDHFWSAPKLDFMNFSKNLWKEWCYFIRFFNPGIKIELTNNLWNTDVTHNQFCPSYIVDPWRYITWLPFFFLLWADIIEIKISLYVNWIARETFRDKA